MFFALERTRKILEELRKYIKTDSIPISSFQMKEGSFLKIADVDADPQSWKTYTTGDKWGGKDYHAWFRTSITIPENFDGKKVMLNIFSSKEGWDALNPQLILYVNGELIQGLDVNHREVILT